MYYTVSEEYILENFKMFKKKCKSRVMQTQKVKEMAQANTEEEKKFFKQSNIRTKN